MEFNVKTVDESEPEDGDVITFTITLLMFYLTDSFLCLLQQALEVIMK